VETKLGGGVEIKIHGDKGKKFQASIGHDQDYAISTVTAE